MDQSPGNHISVEFKGVVGGRGASNEQSRRKGVEREPRVTKGGLGEENFVTLSFVL